ncbi:glucuronoxylan 4-O-methyltransferase 3-like [Dioscorea cayenensis subsp. rotundata]|uniref:Glucuronoxylan 4-O-methyltransferase 3-like n=1 Tax=Dioscorea cayennensis subsp. rotundata TaxID=55577 RepID=A0AB40ARW0_DIOCR|nr:glucuronoxylan 4-O-methyltransferase 3-like [Dioscorea cayenensis subsp. rotundata]
MRSKVQANLNLKHILIGLSLIFLLLLILRPNLSSSSSPSPQNLSPSIKPSSTSYEKQQEIKSPSSCTKIPASLADTIIHYTTQNITPQQTFKEVSVTARVLQKKSPCNFLVFGLGHDSLMWSALNHAGRTVFLEEDQNWIESITSKFPSLEAYHATYNTKVSQAEELMQLGKQEECTVVGDLRYSKCALALKELPSLFYEVEWDLIMVDAPTGYIPEAPGRMGAIYSAGMVARGRKEGETDVFVHDVDRIVEDKFSSEFLCESYLKEQEGRLRHFTIPSHRSELGMPFCPN